ncbi:class I SAM-dependent methyltransferase [candidate division KSB1 bacterium]
MQKRFTHEELKSMYTTAKYTWMTVINDDDNTDPEIYKAYTDHKKKHERFVKKINFNKDDIVGDYGCGNGIFLDLIHDKINKYDGIDLSESYIELAKLRQKENKIDNAEFFCASIEEFSKKVQARYDKIFSFDFSEHLYDEDCLRIFAQMRTTLKEGGKLYIHTPNGDFFIELLKKRGILKQFEEHIGVRNRKEYVKLLGKIGFSHIEVQYLPHYVTLLKFMHLLSYIPFVGKFFKARLWIICTK